MEIIVIHAAEKEAPGGIRTHPPGRRGCKGGGSSKALGWSYSVSNSTGLPWSSVHYLRRDDTKYVRK